MFRSHLRRSCGKAKSEALIVIVLLLGWLALQMFVLPRLGVST